jgi:hypothetical protein
LKRENKHDRLSHLAIFFDSSNLFPLQFSKTCYRKISDVTQSSHAYRHVFILIGFAFYLSLFTFFGCGYTIHGKTSLPFDSIQIVKMENNTLEPKLQDRLYNALTEEFLKQGVAVRPGAGYKLSGTINHFELRILSEKIDIAAEYEVSIRGDFKLVDPSGKIKEFKNIGSPFIVSFQSSEMLEDMLALKELASERAIRDMAMEIVLTLIYPVGK